MGFRGLSFHSGDPARKGHSFLIKFLGSFDDTQIFCTLFWTHLPRFVGETNRKSPRMVATDPS